MKKAIVLLFSAFILSACDLWDVPPQPFPVLTPLPSRTPGIVTPTPVIITPTLSLLTVTVTNTPGIIDLTPVTPTPGPTDTFTPSPTLVTETPTATLPPTPFQSVAVDILGCNTSFDITHGMGEVTNAYVTVKNTGTVDLPNACGLLRAIDEDREHPDKKKCVPNLPVQHQVNLKLTVDSEYKVETIIQVDALSNDVVLLRLDKQSCRDISLFGGAPSDIGVVKPIEQ
jgi:hypothetical protein